MLWPVPGPVLLSVQGFVLRTKCFYYLIIFIKQKSVAFSRTGKYSGNLLQHFTKFL